MMCDILIYYQLLKMISQFEVILSYLIEIHDFGISCIYLIFSDFPFGITLFSFILLFDLFFKSGSIAYLLLILIDICFDPFLNTGFAHAYCLTNRLTYLKHIFTRAATIAPKPFSTHFKVN